MHGININRLINGRFGRNCWSHLQGSSGLKMGPVVWTETSETTNTRCVTYLKSEDFFIIIIIIIYF
jgi:hypothetical protein